jgi:hypothetical protein
MRPSNRWRLKIGAPGGLILIVKIAGFVAPTSKCTRMTTWLRRQSPDVNPMPCVIPPSRASALSRPSRATIDQKVPARPAGLARPGAGPARRRPEARPRPFGARLNFPAVEEEFGFKARTRR